MAQLGITDRSATFIERRKLRSMLSIVIAPLSLHRNQRPDASLLIEAAAAIGATILLYAPGVPR